MDTIHTEKLDNGYSLEIWADNEPENPREFDNLGTIICTKRGGYELGDMQTEYSSFFYMLSDILDTEGIDNEHIIDYWQDYEGYWRIRNKFFPGSKSLEMREYRQLDALISGRIQLSIEKMVDRHFIWLPVYMYEHGGIALNTGGFSCHWDSGQIGVIFVSKAKVRKEYNKKAVSKKLYAQVLDVLKSEVDLYGKYLNGECIGYTLYDENDDFIDSCGGYYDDYEELIKLVKSEHNLGE